jgi:two-component system sensor histidine kinase MtrB
VLRRYLRVLGRRFEHWSAPARRQWRRSLQLRVVALTLVASSLLVGAFGFFVAQNSARRRSITADRLCSRPPAP